MKKIGSKRIAAVILALAVAAAALTGCASKTGGSSSQAKVTPVVAAVIGTTNGYAYVDKSNKLVGYNIDVLNAVFAKLPQYKLSFKITDFQSIFSGVDSGIYQIGAQAFISNADRRQKYIFTDAFGKYVFQIVTSADNTTIKSWKDLGGLTTEDMAGDGPVAIVQAYNKAYPDKPIKLNYVESSDGTLNHIIDQKVDFSISSTTTEKLRAKSFGVEKQIKFVPFGDGAPSYFSTNQYFGFLISKTNPTLANDFNRELEKLISDGTIEKLSKKWFGSSEYAVTQKEATAFRDAKK